MGKRFWICRRLNLVEASLSFFDYGPVYDDYLLFYIETCIIIR